MRKIIPLCMLFFLTLLSGRASLQADDFDGSCLHETGKTKDNFLPAVRLKFEPIFLCDDSAFSILGEVGPKSYRINGTWGFFSDDNQRLKIGAEFLSEKLKFNFKSGRTHQWVHQLAVGGKYQWWFECSDLVRGFQVTGTYSHARNHSLSSVYCPVENTTNLRRIAGSWYWNGGLDLITTPWDCGTFLVGVTYDYVNYKKTFHHNKRLSGVGCSLDLCQRLWCNLFVDLKAQFKRPYNFAEASLSWKHSFACGDLSLGVFGNKVWGKDKLPTVSSAGVELKFGFGVDDCCMVSADYGCDRDTVCRYNTEELALWISDPAVYMPVVLAIADDTLCSSLTVTAFSLPDSVPGGYTFDVAPYFKDPNGNDVDFTAQGLPAGFTISSEGVIKGFNPGLVSSVSTVTIIARSPCDTRTYTTLLFVVVPA